MAFQVIALRPDETIELPLVDLLASKGISGLNGLLNLIFTVDGAGASLLTSTGSVDQSGTYVLDVEPQAIAKGTTKQLPFWSTANGNDTLIKIWNPASSEQDMILKLFYPGGPYEHLIHLEANESTVISVKDLQSKGSPDAKSRSIPATVTSGSAWLSSPSGPDEDLFALISSGTFNALTATGGSTCPTCLGIVSFWITPSQFDWFYPYGTQVNSNRQNTSRGVSSSTTNST